MTLNMRQAVLLSTALLMLVALCTGARVSLDQYIRSEGTIRQTEYKNTKPLIGILTQPCEECPGR